MFRFLIFTQVVHLHTNKIRKSLPMDQKGMDGGRGKFCRSFKKVSNIKNGNVSERSFWFRSTTI